MFEKRAHTCYGLDPGQEPEDELVVAGACANDCGQAACNRILDELRTAAMSGDPSNGRCDALGDGSIGDACRDRLRSSLEAWIGSIEANYDDCVAAAVANSDPGLPYNDPEVPFQDERKLELSDSGCNTNVRRWRSACDALARELDGLFSAYMANLVGVPPW